MTILLQVQHATVTLASYYTSKPAGIALNEHTMTGSCQTSTEVSE